ncbi:MAG TPA: c-type cytochrome [Candidatus Acidoferrum sp.]|jgi:cytochrome c oxidase cbb3-type subunit 3|nr:c-type cytochrome [Candidatus Acidoferrum sp.]
MTKRNYAIFSLAGLFAVGALALHGQTPGPNPAPTVGTNATVSATPAAVRQSGEDPASVARGATVYGASCGSCHGGTAKGTDVGPDLVRSVVVEDDTKGELVGAAIRNAQFHKDAPDLKLTDDQITDVSAWLRVQVYGAAMRDTYAYQNILVGDAKKGEAFFNGPGKCSTCHSVTGDLAGIGGKFDPPTLQTRWISGGSGGRFGRGRGRGLTSANGSTIADTSPPEITPSTITVTVTLASGQSFEGVPIALDDFHVEFKDMTGAYHSYARSGDFPKVVVHNPIQPHWDLLKTITDDQMHDVTAYLVTLK